MGSFAPRTAFPVLDSLPRSYFLGHHKAGLDKMKTMLNSIDLVIECRDYRIPLTSRNPLFEESLAGRERLIVYTKRDLIGKDGREEKAVCEPAISKFPRTRRRRRPLTGFYGAETRTDADLGGAYLLPLFR